MTSLTIDLPDSETAALMAKARARGLSTEQYVRQVLEHDLAPDWLRTSWADSERNGTDQLSMDEIESEIAAARKARCQQRPQPDA